MNPAILTILKDVLNNRRQQKDEVGKKLVCIFRNPEREEALEDIIMKDDERRSQYENNSNFDSNDSKNKFLD